MGCIVPCMQAPYMLPPPYMMGMGMHPGMGAPMGMHPGMHPGMPPFVPPPSQRGNGMEGIPQGMPNGPAGARMATQHGAMQPGHPPQMLNMQSVEEQQQQMQQHPHRQMAPLPGMLEPGMMPPMPYTQPGPSGHIMPGLPHLHLQPQGSSESLKLAPSTERWASTTLPSDSMRHMLRSCQMVQRPLQWNNRMR